MQYMFYFYDILEKDKIRGKKQISRVHKLVWEKQMEHKEAGGKVFAVMVIF